MAFVDDHEEIVGEVIQQAEGAGAGAAAVEEAGVVFDAGAEAELLYHLEVVVHTLFEALGFEGLCDAFEVFSLAVELILYFMDDAGHLALGGHVEIGREDGGVLYLFDALAGLGFEAFYLLYLVAEEGDAVAVVGVGEVDVDGVAFYAESAAGEVTLATSIEAVDEAVEKGVAAQVLALVKADDAVGKLGRVAHTVDAADGGHYNDIAAAAEEVAGGAEAQLFQLFIDGEVFLDVGIGGGDVGFGLVVVVVGNEVFYGIVGEELAELTVELGYEGFVVGEDECGALYFLDDVGHGEGFTGAGNAEECLVFLALIDAFYQAGNGCGLVAGGLVGALNVELHRPLKIRN